MQGLKYARKKTPFQRELKSLWPSCYTNWSNPLIDRLHDGGRLRSWMISFVTLPSTWSISGRRQRAAHRVGGRERRTQRRCRRGLRTRGCGCRRCGHQLRQGERLRQKHRRRRRSDRIAVKIAGRARHRRRASGDGAGGRNGNAAAPREVEVPRTATANCAAAGGGGSGRGGRRGRGGRDGALPVPPRHREGKGRTWYGGGDALSAGIEAQPQILRLDPRGRRRPWRTLELGGKGATSLALSPDKFFWRRPHAALGAYGKPDASTKGQPFTPSLFFFPLLF